MTIQSVLYIGLLLLPFHNTCYSQKPAHNALRNYVVATDTAYQWNIENITEIPGGRFYELSLVSQTWQHITWKHQVIIYFPAKGKYPGTSLLVLRHIYNRGAGIASLKVISDSTGTPSALLYDIPNQPMFDGKEEDDLQAYTFSQYIKSGDESWPLLFPMVKAVVAAMNMIGELAMNKEKKPVNKFIIAGHSKRGHTSWLAALADNRIKGIIPIAIDVLNATRQMPHHLKVFGAYSTPSTEATEFLKELKQPRADSLIQLIDPYAYKEQLTIPKLIVCATNDDYFPTDALNLYWDGLPDPKSVLYLSNASHVHADSNPRINPAAFAFVRAVAANRPLPQFTWEFKPSPQIVQLSIITDTLAKKALLWQAVSTSKDFRTSQWYASPVKEIKKKNNLQFVGELKKLPGVNQIF